MSLAAAFRNSSIRTKLSLLVIFNGSFALLLVGAFLLGYDQFAQREAAVRQLSTQARIAADSSTAALSFTDERAATETLGALRSDPNLVQAAIYDRDNRLFARYERAGPGPGRSDTGKRPSPSVSATPASAASTFVRPRLDGVYFENGYLLAFQTIQIGRERIGAVFLKVSMREVETRLRGYVALVCFVLLVSLGLALLLSARMQRMITGPIANLSVIARGVSLKKDYSVRAIRQANDEVGSLIDSFNEMLAQIELREEARKAAEQSSRESEERFALAARGANDGLWDWKSVTNTMYLSPRGNQMLGYPETEKWWTDGEWFNMIHPSECERVKSELAAIFGGTNREFTGECRMRHSNGTFVWILSRGTAVRDAGGRVVRMAGSLTDITEGKIADPLTGLPNRLYFLDRLEGAIEGSRRRDIVFAVLFLDLDRFKLINDSLGHAAGDELLAEIARRLCSSVHSTGPAEAAGNAC